MRRRGYEVMSRWFPPCPRRALAVPFPCPPCAPSCLHRAPDAARRPPRLRSMTITRQEVAHLARLSRLALDDDELDHLAGQLDVILGAVARVSEVAADDIPPTCTRCRMTNVFRADVPRPVLTARGGARRRARARTAGSGSRASWTRRVSGAATPAGPVTRWTAAQIAGAIADGGRPPSRSPAAHLDRIGAVDAAGARLPARRRRRARWRRPARSTSAGPGERLGPLAGVPLALKDVFTTCGHADDLRLAHPRGLASAVRRDGHRAAARGGRGRARQDQHGRVRHGLVDRELRLRPDRATRGTSRASPAVLRRFGRRGGRGRGAARDRHRHRRLDPPAGRGLRSRRRQADLRRGEPLRPGRVLLQPRPGRPVRPHGARRRAAARGDRAGTTLCDSTSIDAPRAADRSRPGRP